MTRRNNTYMYCTYMCRIVVLELQLASSMCAPLNGTHGENDRRYRGTSLSHVSANYEQVAALRSRSSREDSIFRFVANSSSVFIRSFRPVKPAQFTSRRVAASGRHVTGF